MVYSGTVIYLPFGLTSSPGIFQLFISKILSHIPGVLCYQDDILVLSHDQICHENTLREVLTRLRDAGLKLNPGKCAFFTDHVEYLGFLFDRNGVHPNKNKIDAILQAPSHTNLKQLQSFIGLCNFYSRFVNNFANKMSPFYAVQKKKKLHFDGQHEKNV